MLFKVLLVEGNLHSSNSLGHKLGHKIVTSFNIKILPKKNDEIIFNEFIFKVKQEPIYCVENSTYIVLCDSQDKKLFDVNFLNQISQVVNHD